jgi:hypothetical protein
MTIKQRMLTSIVSSVFMACAIVSPAAADVFLHSTFELHGYDQAILDALGYETGTVTYLKELASITTEQSTMRKDYEKHGCFPFSVYENGSAIESGFNCQTFFCVGYTKGPKVCKNSDGEAYGGVVEINKRLQTIGGVRTQTKAFIDFSDEDTSEYMQRRIVNLSDVRCSPYYIMLFDVAVGEGFTCDEVGAYPYFSNKNNCSRDWRTDGELKCDIALREDEFDQRRQAILLREEGMVSASGSANLSSMSSSSAFSHSSASSQASSARPLVTFPDVIQGHHGYTAITDLAGRGIVQGYADGSFRPYQIINRAEFSKFLMAGLHSNQLIAETYCFPDVLDEWYSAFVCAAKRLSWIQGYTDGKFYPARTISKAEAMAIIIQSLGVSLDSTAALPPGVKEGEWYTPYIRKAMELGLILEPAFDPQSAVMRADAAVWMYRSLKTSGQ